MALGAPGQHAHWSSRFAFIMAAVGSAVGLGNLWRFPFQVGQNGGSAFVIVYIVCVVLVAFPILMAELSVGRSAQMSAVGSTRKMAQNAGAPGWWSVAGWVGMVAAFLILCTYSVVAGQVMAYAVSGFTGEFASLTDQSGPANYQSTLDGLLWHTAFMAITIFIVSRGLKGGIEGVVTVLMPIFFLMLIGLAIYSLMEGDTAETLAYMFTPRFGELAPQTFLAALGQAFFSIGVGGAIMITYGSYLSRDENIGSSAGIIASADTLVAIVAGLMIFPIVFLVGLDPAQGGNLIFSALPNVFAGMPFGNVIGGAFFGLAFIAALTSSISLLQVVAAWAEEHTDLPQSTSAMLFGGIAWMIGAGAAHSSEFGGFVDIIAGEIALPLGGLLIAVFAGWVVPKATMRHELSHASNGLFAFWHIMIKFVAPIAVSLIILFGLSDRFGWGLSEAVFGTGEEPVVEDVMEEVIEEAEDAS